MSKALLNKSALIISILFSISLLFSCASKQEEDVLQEPVSPETELSETVETPEAEDDTPDLPPESQVFIPETKENETEENKTPEYEEVFELEEIPDPVVYEISLPPLPEETETLPEEVPEEITEPAPLPLPLKEEEIIELPEIPESTISAPENIENEIENSEDEPDSIDVTESYDQIEDEVEDVESVESVTDEETDSDTLVEDEGNQDSDQTTEIIPSRSVSMNNGQSLDIEYPGKGWIYLGCTDGSKSLTSAGRRITGSKNTVFTLIAKIPGTVILHFYKEDLLADKYIDDYLEVTVSEIKSKSSFHVKAPAYSEAVPKKPEEKIQKHTEPAVPQENKTEVLAEPKKENKPVTKTATPETTAEKPVNTNATVEKKEEPVVSPTETIPVPEKVNLLNPEEYLEAARKALDEKRWTDCYNNLQIFIETTDKNKDEGYFLLGKFYEANSDYRNVKKSIEAYKEVTDGYPLSKFYDEAEKRIIYLQRFYINIR